MPKLKQSSSDKAQYKSYPTRFEKNKLAKLEKVAKAQPNNKPLQAKLLKALDKGIRYTRNRKSGGHACKGLNKTLGFVKNQPTDIMIKGKASIHEYTAGEVIFKNSHVEPNHGQNMRTQLEALGFKWSGYGRRKHKKTAR